MTPGVSSPLFFPQRVTSRSPGRSVRRSRAPIPARTAAAPQAVCAPAGAAGAAGAAAAAPTGTRSPWRALSTSCQRVSPDGRPSLASPTRNGTYERRACLKAQQSKVCMRYDLNFVHICTQRRDCKHCPQMLIMIYNYRYLIFFLF